MSARFLPTLLLGALMTPIAAMPAAAQPDPAWIYEAPGPSPNAEHRGPRRLAAEIGTLSMMTAASRSAVLARVDGARIYDLSVRYFVGLPSWYGADDLPPIIARGVLIDVAGLKKLDVLPDAYRITPADLEAALAAQRVRLSAGDIVLIRGGKITLEAAEWLAETHAAMIIGGDYLSLEQYRIGRPDLTVPVHNYLLRRRGIAIIQIDNLDQLARDSVYEFAFVAASIRPRGAAGLEFRPLAMPLRPEQR